MKKVMVVMLVLGCLAFAAVAYAQPAPAGGGGEKKANRLDKDGDGVVSKDEFPGRAEAFTKADSNGDGVIDSAEMAASREKLQEKRKGEGGPERGPMSDAERLRERMRGVAQFGAALFRVVDTDNDGKLSMPEIDDFAATIKAADADKDGFVSKEEIRNAFRERIVIGVGQAFMKKYDKDRDGKVTREEFAGEDARFKWADVNADGVVTMEDFKQRAGEAPQKHEGAEKGGQHRRRERAPSEETPAVTPPAVTPPAETPQTVTPPAETAPAPTTPGVTPASTPQEESKKSTK